MQSNKSVEKTPFDFQNRPKVKVCQNFGLNFKFSLILNFRQNHKQKRKKFETILYYLNIRGGREGGYQSPPSIKAEDAGKPQSEVRSHIF